MNIVLYNLMRVALGTEDTVLGAQRWDALVEFVKNPTDEVQAAIQQWWFGGKPAQDAIEEPNYTPTELRVLARMTPVGEYWPRVRVLHTKRKFDCGCEELKYENGDKEFINAAGEVSHDHEPH